MMVATMAMTPSLNRLLAFKIRHAAEDGLLIICHCYRCKSQQVFWAADLVAVGDGETSVMEFGRGCGRCGDLGRTRTWAHFPGPGDSGRFEILRPAGVEQTQLWRREWFENPPPPLKDDAVLAPPVDRQRR